MGLSFTAPELLLLLLPLVGITALLSIAARHHLSLARRRVGLGLRLLLLTLLVFALAGFQLRLPVDGLSTVFVVDLSDSVGAAGRENALAFVREALKEKPDGDKAGIVAFGADALPERIPSELKELDEFASTPARTATDVGAALRLASALFPDETQKRIVLISDGNDTTGRGLSEAALSAARGIQVATHVIGLGAADEVIVDGLHTPSTARVGEDIEAEVTIRSTVRQPATVRLFQLGEGTPVSTQSVTLEVGTNRVLFVVKAREAGFHRFRAVVEVDADTFAQNNRADSDTIVKGDPRILVVAGDKAMSGNLVAALKAERQDVTEITPAAMPEDLTAMASYDSIVLVDVAATELGMKRMTALQSYARDLGRGVVMLGGQRSFGAGGYKKTPLEEVLPVDMDVRDRNKQPDIALVVVIDKSGSMDACHCNTANRDLGSALAGVPKVDIGKEAILRAVSALTARDEFGVVAFNENAQWSIHTAPLGTIGNVEEQIAGIRPEGQTNIFAGLSAAVDELEKSTATRRHMILLTDGWSSSGAYADLLKRMKAANITLSTVGAGGGSADFLKDLARDGGGKYYNATNPAGIPDIFLKETQQVSGQQIVEEAFFPVVTGDSPILKGLDAGLPQLLGYNGTTAKSAAQTVLVSSRDDPVLAQWQYGLGRSVAWTSDATGRWAKSWVAWPGFDRFFSQLVAWTFPGEETGGIEASFVSDGDDVRLRIESVDANGTPRDFYDTNVTLVSPDVDSRNVRLVQVAPGVYEAKLGRIDPGAYALRVTQTRDGATSLGRTLGLVAPTAAEYRLLGTNERLLGALRGATGGSELATGREAWAHDLRTTDAARDLWPVLLLLALLLWPIDVAIRRVSLARTDLVLARAWWQARRGPAVRPQRVRSMLAAKERAAGTRTRAALGRSPDGATEATGDREAAATIGADPPAAGAAHGTPLTAGANVAPLAAPTRATGSVPEAGLGQGDEVATGTVAAPPIDTLARLREAKRRAGRQ
ncbi:MAG: VWA domain-containing protein [Chloroflexi bacterium]|nr:VWA domain-containing protein [Chloroflexota bacterium]